MQRLQAPSRTRSGRPRRHRRGVGHRRQPDQRDAQRRPARHHAASPRRRAATHGRRDRRSGSSTRSPPIPGMTVYFQPVQDIQIQHARRAARSTSTRWSPPTRAEVIEWSDRLVRRLRAKSRAARGRVRGAGRRPAHAGRRRSRAGRPARRLDAGVNDTLNDAFGQRQISTIYGQANQYRVILEAQPRYQQDPAALSKLYVTGASTSTGTAATVGNTATGTTNTNTTATPNAVTSNNQVPLSAFARFVRHRRRSRSRIRSSFLRSRSASIWRTVPRCATRLRVIRAAQSRDRHAVLGDRQLFGRRRRVRQIAGRASRG